MARKKEYIRIKQRFLALLLILSGLSGIILGVNIYKVYPAVFSSSVKSAVSAISAKNLKEKLANKDFNLINVHTPYEGEIERTDSFIEYDSMKANETQLPKDKNASIVLYCKSGRMSAEAFQTLKEMGYTNVSHLEGGMDAWRDKGYSLLDLSSLPAEVLPDEGFDLPVSWGHIGPRLVELGVIDLNKFGKTVNPTLDQEQILTQETQEPIKINAQNSQFVVDVLWALGLAQKSLIYEQGPMGMEYKDQAGNFAATGGWTLARGDAMDHYNKHDLIPLTEEQQKKVMEIAQNVYRPCCGNHTAFPDCNHGMAALAAIELMVAKGLSDEEIYKNVLSLNSFWFPGNYLTTATFFARQGTSWDKVDAKLVLGADYSSSKGAAEISQKVGPLPYEGFQGGSCGA